MLSKRYKHLRVPEYWRSYFTKYPQGLTILEALIEWVSQVDSMVDDYNLLKDHVDSFKDSVNNITDGFRSELDDFLNQFDTNLQDKVINTLSEWQNSGFLDIVIDQALETKFHEMDDRLTSQLAQIAANVKAYGAKGDGIADDTLAIQNTINDNEVVFIPTGIYKISQTLHVPTNRKIYGAGLGKTLIVWDEEDSKEEAMILPLDQTHFFDFSLDHKRSERGILDQQTNSAIGGFNNDVLIKRIGIRNTIGPGISGANVNNITIKDCIIEETRHHNIYFSGNVDNVTIENNILKSPAIISDRAYGANIIKLRGNEGDTLKNITIRDNFTGIPRKAESDLVGMLIRLDGAFASVRFEHLNIENNVFNHLKEGHNYPIRFIATPGQAKGEQIGVKHNTFNGGGDQLEDEVAILSYFNPQLDDPFNFIVRDNHFYNFFTAVSLRRSLIESNTFNNCATGVVQERNSVCTKNTFVLNGAQIGIKNFDSVANENTFTSEILTEGSKGVEIYTTTKKTFIGNNFKNIHRAFQGQYNNHEVLDNIFMGNNFEDCAFTYDGNIKEHSNSVEPDKHDRRGATVERPVDIERGFRFYDTTLDQPIWWTGEQWVDGSGTTV